MSERTTPKTVVALALALWVIFALATALFSWDPPAPSESLKAWSASLVSVIGGAVGIGALWEAPKLLRKYLGLE
jgi:hypothetical protein